jgi:MFS-type transporter involved in bile tolerance (Atg22 family)
LSDQRLAVPESETERADGGPLGIKGLAWAIFEGARNPYYNLIVIYVFAPYFAKELAGGGEHGLSLSGLTVTTCRHCDCADGAVSGGHRRQGGPAEAADCLLHGAHVHLLVQLCGGPARTGH